MTIERREVGRYVLYGKIAAGGMAVVHFGRLVGPVGFARTVAIKRLHPHLAQDPEFVAMFLDEARLVARIRHPNVVQTLDVVAADGELLLVMDYVQGESLGRLIRLAKDKGGLPPNIVSAVGIGMLEGLHAAHEAKSDRGEPLGIVHRDVSPQNVLVGIDGIAHVLDFGVAKAAGKLHQTEDGKVKGKFAYMSPEQLKQKPIDRRTDVFAASTVLWEALTGRKLFQGDSPASIVFAVVDGEVKPPSSLNPSVPPELDAVIMRGLAKRPEDRFASAHDMAVALEDAVTPATPRKLQEWVKTIAGDVLGERAKHIAEIESDSAVHSAIEPISALSAISEISNASASAPRSAPRASAPSISGVTDGPTTGTAVTAAAVTEQPSSRKKKSSVPIVLAALLGSAIAAGMFFAFKSGSESSPAPAGNVTESVGASAGDVEREAEKAEKPAPTASVAAPTAAPSASAAPDASTNATNTSIASIGTGDGTQGQAPKPIVAPPKNTGYKPPPKAADCSNPFIIDANGRKRPRPECF